MLYGGGSFTNGEAVLPCVVQTIDIIDRWCMHQAWCGVAQINKKYRRGYVYVMRV